ncbi:MAG: PIN domain-containing protein [Microbacteriaceae bacterium]|nr:MAG: PIN domain-containing protein [Microbacteriaceae bacterium]
MTKSAMLDTSVIIQGIPEDIIDDIENYCSSAIVRAELMHGLYSFVNDPAVPEDRVKRRRLLIQNLDALEDFWADFGIDASDGYGILAACPKSAIRQKDALIAGHAVALKLPLITHDTGFSRFDADVRIIQLNDRDR